MLWVQQHKVSLQSLQTFSRKSLIRLYTDYYESSHNSKYFIRINKAIGDCNMLEKDYALYPSLSNVIGSNFCQIGVDFDSSHQIIKVISVTDNLIKGAAGNAIQNINIMFDIDEKSGLTQYGL